MKGQFEDVKKMFDPRKSWKQTGLYPILGNDELKKFLKMKENFDKVSLEGGEYETKTTFPSWVVYMLGILLVATIIASSFIVLHMYRSKKILMENKV